MSDPPPPVGRKWRFSFRGRLRNALASGTGRELVFSALVGLAGYPILLGFWLTRAHAPALPGLPKYLAASWGDGLMLPVATFCLFRVAGQFPAVSGFTSGLGALVGGLLGLGVVGDWRYSNSIALNWTMPREHSFNGPGWYHAAYLVGTCAVLGFIGTDLVRRLRSSPEHATARLGSANWAVAVGCGLAYATLNVTDAHRAALHTTAQLLAGASFIPVVALVATCGYLARPTDRGVGIAIAAALASAGAVAFLSVNFHASFANVALVAAACAAGVVIASDRSASGNMRASNRTSVEALASSSLYSIAGVLSTVRHTSTLWVLVAAIVAVACSMLLHAARCGWAAIDGTYLATAVISAAFLGVCVFAGLDTDRRQPVTAGLLLTISGAVLGSVFFGHFKVDFEELMGQEAAPTSHDSKHHATQAQGTLARDVWLRVGGYAVGGFGSMLVLTIAVSSGLGWTNAHSTLSFTPILTTVVAAISASLLAWRSIAFASYKEHIKPAEQGDVRRRPPEVSPSEHRRALIATGIGALVTLFVLGRAADPASGIAVLPAVQAGLLGVFATECMIGNGARLPLVRIRLAEGFVATVAGLAVATTIYYSLVTAIRTHHHVVALGEAAGVGAIGAAAAVLLTVTATSSIYAKSGREYPTQYVPVANAVQDAFLIVVMWLVLGWIPSITLAHIPASAPERWSAVGLVLAGYLLIFGPVLLWILENNDKHIGRMAGLRGLDTPAYASADARTGVRFRSLARRLMRYARLRTPDPLAPDDIPTRDRAFISALEGHVALQNTVALVLASVTVIGIIGVSTGLESGVGSVENRAEN